MSTRKTAAEVAAELNKKFADDDDHPVIVRGSELIDQQIRRLPTGVLALDVALGGGWPIKQWSEVYGPESSGKTALVYLTIAAAQKENPNFEVVWVAAEEFVPSYAALFGVDLDRIHLIETNVMEEALDRLLAFIEARSVDMAVIDSLPALVPNEEAEKDVGDLQVALQARITGKYFRKVRHKGKRSLVVEDRPVTGLIVNQYRVNVGGWAPHGQEPTTTPGGRAKNYNYFVRLALKPTETKVHPERKQFTHKGNKADIPIGHEIRAIVEKNKSGPDGRIAVYDLYTAPNPEFGAGAIDRGKDVFMTADMLDVVVRRGPNYYFDDGTEEGVKIARGKDAAFAALLNDEELHDRVIKECYARMNA